jgi:nicotinamide mononucleotide transporter
LSTLSTVLEQAKAQSLPEVVAVVTAVLYLLFAIRQQIICWLFAAISTAIYIWLFLTAKLYMESVLNVFYLVMAGYGWAIWSSGKINGHDRPVVVWPFSTHAVAIVAIVVVSAVNGYLLSAHTDAAFPYIDSLTTWSAIWATFLVARKVLENWWYWLVIDIASVLIYWSRDLQLTSILFGIYVIMIPIGLISWTKSMHRQ